MAPEKDPSSETGRGPTPEAQQAGDQTVSASPASRRTLLLDLNVILDVLQKRQPHYEASARVWAAVEEGSLRGFVELPAILPAPS